MKTMKQILTILLVLTTLLSCLAGCSDGTDTIPNTLAATTTSSKPSKPEPEPEEPVEITAEMREAVMCTALAYLARGTRIQYDDTRLLADNPPSTPVVYRWQSCVRKSPEEYTSQYAGYTNCAAFVGEVYLAAVGMDLGTQTTGGLTGIVDQRRVLNYHPTGKETEEEKATFEAEFRATLEYGDIIVIRYGGEKAGQGHAMLYVDSTLLATVDGYEGTTAKDTYVYDIIHSTGSNYKYNTGTENYEPYGSIQKTSVDTLFDSTHGRYVFSQLLNIAIIRPLNVFRGEIPQNTLNRMENLYNVVAEKLSTHSIGQTVEPGDDMTFTFRITNRNAYAVTLTVADIVPANTTLVSAENGKVDGTSLEWEVTVPAGETVTVAYTVKVNADAPVGTAVYSADGTVGGVTVKCPGTYIGRTLSPTEQRAIKMVSHTLQDNGLRGLALANAIYADTFGVSDLLPEDYSVLKAGLYMQDNGYYYLAADGAYQNLVVPALFGGMVLQQRLEGDPAQLAKYEDQRIRLMERTQLIAGDVIVADTNVKCTIQAFYLYTGETLLDLSTGTLLSQEDAESVLIACISYARFAVLRPSLGME